MNSKYSIPDNEIIGDDWVSVHIGTDSINGFFEKSPLAERLNGFFNYNPKLQSIKPFVANWMVYENYLLLGHVNGRKDGRDYHFSELLPEYPDNELLHEFNFTGPIAMRLDDKNIPKVFADIIGNCDYVLLRFDSGKLIKMEGI